MLLAVTFLQWASRLWFSVNSVKNSKIPKSQTFLSAPAIKRASDHSSPCSMLDSFSFSLQHLTSNWIAFLKIMANFQERKESLFGKIADCAYLSFVILLVAAIMLTCQYFNVASTLNYKKCKVEECISKRSLKTIKVIQKSKKLALVVVLIIYNFTRIFLIALILVTPNSNSSSEESLFSFIFILIYSFFNLFM